MCLLQAHFTKMSSFTLIQSRGRACQQDGFGLFLAENGVKKCPGKFWKHSLSLWDFILFYF